MSKYSDYVKEYVRLRLGLERDDTSKDDYIDRMSRNEVFASVLEWEGIIGYDLMIRNLIEDIYKVSLSEEPIVPENSKSEQSKDSENENVSGGKMNPFNSINSSIVADTTNQDGSGEVCEVCGDCPKFSEHSTSKPKDTQIKKGRCDKWNQDGLFADTKACSYAYGKTVDELR